MKVRAEARAEANGEANGGPKQGAKEGPTAEHTGCTPVSRVCSPRCGINGICGRLDV
jgi:hypothetical protein